MKLRVIKAYVVKDLKIVFSDKATLFWMIAWPLIWIFIVAYVFVPPGSVSPVQLDIGVVNYDYPVNETLNFTSLDFIEILNKTEYEGSKMFNVVVYDNETLLRDDLRKGRIDLGLIIPKNFSVNITYGIARIKVLIGARDPYSSSINYAVISMFIDQVNTRIGLIRANITINYVVKYASQYFNSTNTPSWFVEDWVDYLRQYYMGIAIPINASYEDVKPPALMNRENILGWYVIGAIGMMFLYSGFSYGASMIVSEKERGTLKRLLASPITESELIVSMILSGIATLTVSALIAILVGVFGTGAHVLFDPFNPLHWLVPVLIIVGAFMSIGIGIMLSLLAKTSQGASSLGVALGLMLSFTAGIWFPRTMMPTWMGVLADVFPVAWVFNAIRSIMVFNRGFNEVYPLLVKILIAFITILVIDLLIYKLRLRKYIEEV